MAFSSYSPDGGAPIVLHFPLLMSFTGRLGSAASAPSKQFHGGKNAFSSSSFQRGLMNFRWSLSGGRLLSSFVATIPGSFHFYDAFLGGERTEGGRKLLLLCVAPLPFHIGVLLLLLSPPEAKEEEEE